MNRFSINCYFKVVSSQRPQRLRRNKWWERGRHNWARQKSQLGRRHHCTSAICNQVGHLSPYFQYHYSNVPYVEFDGNPLIEVTAERTYNIDPKNILSSILWVHRRTLDAHLDARS